MRKLPIEPRHGLLPPIGDHKQHQLLALVHIGPVHPVIPPPLELDNVVLLQRSQPGVPDHLCLRLRVGVDEVLELVVLLELLLGDEVVKLGENDRDVLGDVGEPGELALGGLDVSIGDKDSLEPTLDFGELDDAPSRQNYVLSHHHPLRVDPLQQDPPPDPHQPLPEAGILGQVVCAQKLHPSLLRVCDRQRHVVLSVDRHKPLGVGVDLFLVLSPELGPLHVHDAATGSL
mmetsp:Transcript_48635/g.103447  ORF Transcript_48635/g.103447 Transcript_48635/m.103447 type:complete len:231 (+) Transcript_48635:97-789(+)